MNITYIATDSYASILGVSMFSLLENSSDLSALNIYILSTDIGYKNKLSLIKLADKYKATLHFINISGFEQSFSCDFATSGFHPIVLARLLLADYLPSSVESVLYLDCDVIINGSLSDLEYLSFSNQNCAFAAVPELCMPLEQKKHLGLSANDVYYNCGVLLINLNYWRSHNLQQHFTKYYTDMKGNLLYNDQDILNHCCKGHIMSLPHIYNLPPVLHYFPRYFIRSYQPLYYCKTKEEYKNILQHPVIIHYLGEERPWIHGNFSPYRKVYYYYKSLSPWKNTPLIYGKELYMLCYHGLNCITFICPWFRKFFTRRVGIHYYKLVKKI